MNEDYKEETKMKKKNVLQRIVNKKKELKFTRKRTKKYEVELMFKKVNVNEKVEIVSSRKKGTEIWIGLRSCYSHV